VIDDAALLNRRKRTAEAILRLEYTISKCSMFIEEEKLGELRVQLQRVKQSVLMVLARVRRKQGQFSEAIDLCSKAMMLINQNDKDEHDQQLAQMLLFRAKCHFAAQDTEKALIDASHATQLNCDEAHELLDVLRMPSTSLAERGTTQRDLTERPLRDRNAFSEDSGTVGDCEEVNIDVQRSE
jgi:tetratricopeptide (TPR) repeat protein